ncbi:carbohydrate-binding module family 50 protein [Lentithecium fluviatile CBS 122367]|uniref:Carbohydrate-binding module family 50 protein n=1 Tax=Lentithecium fluviatile CBS 122367 TaxID=1168545 RepID=A0A6G1JDD6_9PLEO|nr:carbohydrate-binding module family 50 protein [Lentithecium fluviatile CBS 122367]
MRGLVGRAAAARLACWTFLAICAVNAQDAFSMSDTEIMGFDLSGSFFSDLHPCPIPCKEGRPNNWTVYTSMDRLALCDEPLLFDFAVTNPVADPNTVTKLHVCTATGGNESTTTNAEFNGSSSKKPVVFTKRADDCNSTAVESTATVNLAWSGEGNQGDRKAVLVGLANLKKFSEEDVECDASPFMFSYTRSVISGVYSGRFFGRATASNVIEKISDSVGSEADASTLVAQICGKGRASDRIFGATVFTSKNISTVQNAIKSWSDAKCVGDLDSSSELKGVSIFESPLSLSSNGTFSNTTSASATTQQALHLLARAECSYIKVVSGDGCGTLASKCGISGADLTKYNPDPKLCSTLAPGQPVCCSSGSLPDLKPKPNADGTCATYRVMTDDTCDVLAASNGIKTEDIDKWNEGQT